MMNKEAKKNYVEEMKKNLTANESVMIAQYQGLNVNELDALRKELREKGILFKITKNRITKIALEKTRAKELSKLFAGPTAIALSDDAIIIDLIVECNRNTSSKLYVPLIFDSNVSKGLSFDVSKSANAAKLKTYSEPRIACSSFLIFNIFP